MNVNDWSSQDKQNLGAYLQFNSYRSERYKIFYVATPKVACTTLKWWVAALEGYSENLRKITDGGESDPDLIVHESHKIAPNVTGLRLQELSEALESDSFFRFAVVRNPYKRVFSAWQSKLLLREPLQVGPYVDTNFYHHPINTAGDIAKAFESFLEHLAKNEAPSYWDHHWRPQVALLRPDLINYSKLVRIEESEKLSQALVSWLGAYIPDPFQGRRSNESLIPYVPEFVTDRSADLIRTLYAQDFDVFGYDKQPPMSKETFTADQCDVAIKAIKLIRGRHRRLGERNAQIIGLSQTLAERDGEISGLNQTLAERDGEISGLNQTLAERGGEISGLNQILAERDGEISGLNQTLAERNGQINFQGEWIQALLQSRSWRWTKPLRIISGHVSAGARLLRAILDRSPNGSFQQKMHRRFMSIYNLLCAIPRAVAFYQGSPSLALQRAFRVWRQEGIGGIQRRVNILLGGLKSDSRLHQGVNLYGDLPAANPEFNPKVSIIVPNYNHAPYLRQRLESIFHQTYQNVEVILLDDCSCDDSVEILLDFARRFPERTVCNFNELNSGSVFRQWKKGFEIATGELIWIAESDDYCAENFLAEQVRFFQNPGVMLSFCKTEFVSGDSTKKVWSLSEYLSDLGMADWDQPFIRSANALVNAGWAVKNIVSNASSALFRHPRGLPIINDPRWLGLRLCGDWVFYLSVIRGGLVAYTPDATNYYRQHDRSTSQTTQREDLYYAEHEVVASNLVEHYRLDRSILDKQDSSLYLHWCNHRGSSLRSEFRRLYDADRVWTKSVYRRPNVAMVVYALTAGGGETFPIILANLLHERGYAVTLLNCRERPTEPGVLKMLDPRIPLLELHRLELAGAVLADMGIELVHPHHAWVDLTLANALVANQNIRHVVTTHGMYEMMTPGQLDAVMPLLSARIDHVIFTADKNLAGFPESFRQSKKLTRISNALPSASFNPVDRNSLNISHDDFVLCMVARGIPEKGWTEAIQAVNLANAQSERKIHLILIGDGPEYVRLREIEHSANVQFLGFRQNIRDYFASCDMGFLPSRFKGESAPLVVIDCLLTGKPVLASDIAEIRCMLDSQDGLAGELFPLHDWKLDVEAIAKLIVDLANHPSRYDDICARVPSAALKFSVATMVESYEAVYRDVLS